jgi:hypothetical protein
MSNLIDVCWHDGVLSSAKILPGKSGSANGEVVLELALYPINKDGTNPDWSRPREQKQIIFERVVRLALDLDFAELGDNYRAGNIDRASIEKVNSGHEALLLQLLGGQVTITFTSAKFLSAAKVNQLP